MSKEEMETEEKQTSGVYHKTQINLIKNAPKIILGPVGKISNAGPVSNLKKNKNANIKIRIQLM